MVVSGTSYQGRGGFWTLGWPCMTLAGLPCTPRLALPGTPWASAPSQSQNGDTKRVSERPVRVAKSERGGSAKPLDTS